MYLWPVSPSDTKHPRSRCRNTLGFVLQPIVARCLQTRLWTCVIVTSQSHFKALTAFAASSSYLKLNSNVNMKTYLKLSNACLCQSSALKLGCCFRKWFHDGGPGGRIIIYLQVRLHMHERRICASGNPDAGIIADALQPHFQSKRQWRKNTNSDNCFYYNIRKSISLLMWITQAAFTFIQGCSLHNQSCKHS